MTDRSFAGHPISTSAPTPDGATSSAGSALSVASASHVHGRYHWTPPDHGLVTWTWDPALQASASTVTSGVLQLARVHVPIAATITNIILAVTTAGTSLTSGQNFAVLYTAAGAKVDVTADQTTAWGTTGTKTMALAGGAYSAAPGDYDIAWWATNTAGSNPSFARTGSLPISVVGLSAANSRFATADTGLTTTAPATRGTKTASIIAWWAGLS